MRKTKASQYFIRLQLVADMYIHESEMIDEQFDDMTTELHHDLFLLADEQVCFEVMMVLLFDVHVVDENELSYILMLLNPLCIKKKGNPVLQMNCSVIC